MSSVLEDDRFAHLDSHFDAELLLCSILDAKRNELDAGSLVRSFLTTFDTEKGCLCLLRGSLFCSNALVLEEVLREVRRRALPSPVLCKTLVNNGFDDKKRSCVSTPATIQETERVCIGVLAEDAALTFKLACSFARIAHARCIAALFDASSNAGRLVLAVACHRCFGFLPVLASLRRESNIVEETPHCDDAEWSSVFRGIGLQENTALLQRLFVKYVKLVDAEQSLEVRAALITAAAALWQRIGRIKITRDISRHVFDAATCRVKYAEPSGEYGCALEAFEAAHLVFNLVRGTVASLKVIVSLTSCRKIQALVAAYVPENIFAHIEKVLPFGVELVLFLANAGNRDLLTYLFVRTHLLNEPMLVAALKREFAALSEGDAKTLLSGHMRPLMSDSATVPALKKTRN